MVNIKFLWNLDKLLKEKYENKGDEKEDVNDYNDEGEEALIVCSD